jgi:F0F1-type ATP synthase assembly protein I
MVLLLIGIIFSINIVSSDKNDDESFSGGHSMVRVVTPRVRTPIAPHLLTSSIAAAVSHVQVDVGSDDSLCDIVVKSSVISQSRHVQYIRPFVVEVIRESSSSPVSHNVHRVKSIERLRSGDSSPDREDSANINEIVIEALQKAMDKQQEDIDDRWSKSSVAISSTISSIVVGVIVGLSQYFSTK